MIPMMQRPIDKAVSDTLKNLRSALSFLGANEYYYNQYIPSYCLDLIGTNAKNVIVRFIKRKNKLPLGKNEVPALPEFSENAGILLLHNANSNIFEGLHIDNDPADKFVKIAAGINILKNGAAVLPSLRDKESPIIAYSRLYTDEPSLFEGFLTDEQKSTLDTIRASLEECVGYSTKHMFDKKNVNENFIRESLAVAAFKMAEEELAASSPDYASASEYAKTAPDFMQKGLKYSLFTQENENRVEIQHHITYQFAMGL